MDSKVVNLFIISLHFTMPLSAFTPFYILYRILTERPSTENEILFLKILLSTRVEGPKTYAIQIKWGYNGLSPHS